MENSILHKRHARVIPWGYEVSEENTDYLVAIIEQLDALKEAKEYLKSCSQREVCSWLLRKTGRSITPRGLQMVLNREY